MLNRVVNKTGKEDNLGILNKVVNTTAIDKDLVEANPVLQKVVNTIDPLPSQSSGGAISSCVIACIDKNIKEVQCVACINTCEIDNIKNTTCVSLEKVTADYVCSNTLSSSCIEVGKISAEDANVGTLYAQCICYDSIQVSQCTSSPKAVVTVGLCSSYKVCVDDDTVYSEKVCSDSFYGCLKGKASNTDCFDGKTFEEAKANILSGKAKCSELADYAKNVCIETRVCSSGFIPFVDNKCVMFLAQDYNPKVMFDKDGICINVDGCLVTKDINAVCSCSSDAVTDRLEVKQCASFNGPVYIYDNIYQCGESWCTHAQNIYTCSDTITLREGATFAGNAQIKVSKYDGTNNGVIFLGTDGTLRVGDENNCQPVLTRSEEKDLTDGHVLVWDATNRCARDSGEGLVTCAYVTQVGTACKDAACNYAKSYTDICNCCTRDYVDLCFTCIDEYTKGACNYTDFCTTCSKSYTDTKALCSCVYAVSCGHNIGCACKDAACLYTSCTDSCNKAWTSACICESCIDSFSHADCVGTDCYKKACLCALNTDKLCYACSSSYTNTVGTECYKKACLCALNVDKICYACSKSYADCVGTDCYKKACSCAINMDALCLACSYACGKDVCTSAISRENTCLSCAYACVNAVCCNTINMDTLCLSCAYTCANTVGTACKNDAMATKANCYGNSYSCVQCAYIAKNVDLECYVYPAKRFVYIGNPTEMNGTIGCNAYLWFCPTCNVFVVDGSTGSGGSAICLTGFGSCLMNGVCSRKNPSIVFSTTDKQCGCLQYSQYDTVHPGSGLCWGTNTPNTWFDTDCIYANKFINRNGCQIGGYCATLPSPNGTARYVLLDLGNVDTDVYYNVYNNNGTIAKTRGDKDPISSVYSEVSYGIYGFSPLNNNCLWIKIGAYRPIYLWGKYPIKVVSNTTTNPGCTWQAPTIKPTCYYVSTVAGQCKSDACTYANTVAGQCKDAACSFTTLCTSCYAKCYGGSSSCVAKANVADGTSTYNNYTLEQYSASYDRPIAVTSASGCCAMKTTMGFVASTAKPFTYNPSTGILKVGGTLCTRGGICPVAECCYVANVGGQCKSASCTYAQCAINACKGIGVMGVARSTNGQCWTKGGYWAYMTTLDGPNCCWNHVIKMDWSANVDPWITGISIPTYNSHHYGIHYKNGCCGGHSGWTLVPDISCVQTLSGSCASSIGTACKNAACAFTVLCVDVCAGGYAKCYGNVANCVAYANAIKVNVENTDTYFKIPFVNSATIAENKNLYIDGGNAFPSYNPSTNVFCGYTVCVAQTLAVRNANGGFRLGNYCIYIE